MNASPNNSPLCNANDHVVSRRQLLGAAAAGAAGVGGLGGLLQPVVGEELKQQEKQVLFVWLDGGISQLESWDPKPNTQFGGPYRAIPTSVPGVHISELLPHTAQQLHHLSIVRSVHTQDNSHSAGVGRINRGDPKNRGVIYPYLGSAVAKLLGPTASGLPPYCWVKPYSGGFKTADAGFLPAKYGALAFGDAQPPENILLNESITPEQNELRNDLRKRFNQQFATGRRRDNVDANSYVYDVADTLMQRLDLFDDSKITARDKERYGQHALGRHMLMGRRLIEAGVRFVKVNSYHWDSHGDNFNACESLIPQFDQPFAALLEDLDERGMLDNVLVIAMSEFGRTPRINSHVGRDHWPEAWSVVMGGAGIRRGQVVGKTNALGTFVDSQEYDIGHLFHTWFRALGVPPEMMEYDNNGQPLPVAHDDCSPIDELLS
ncbi:MAG TPA: DUF1501 domain-containing protein [Planctomycetaceae bacterium]|nr:hypothetical protein [Blastopirellula sp.]HAY82528.1 DUF1501 domain-containing protein [Planctomycetaceae bacterium]